MRITYMIIKGFRCFDCSGQTILLDNFTCFVGPNASGKTAAMLALGRLFGETQGMRQVKTEDFHLAHGERLDEKSERHLSIECRLEFPELDAGNDENDSIPATFNHMTIESEGKAPFCRIRLEAKWTNDNTMEGSIDQKVQWITTPLDDKDEMAGHRYDLKPYDRGRIRFLYAPAHRDPQTQIQNNAGTAFGRLIRSLDWGGIDVALKETLEDLQSCLGDISGIKSINKLIQESWSNSYDGKSMKNVNLEAVDQEVKQLVNLLAPIFRPGEAQKPVNLSFLSDGLRSLFSISLSLGFLKLEEVLRSGPDKVGFVADILEKLPVLTIFALEEPENHLSPHYLGRVISQLQSSADCSQAQVILSSHSPSILRRIQPDNVRYFLGHELESSSSVIEIPLPATDDKNLNKFVREAVRGYPELYFSRLVILGEGPSEEIVLQHIFEASGNPLDTLFISIVPIGGRHVNHFWRLLHGLKIPYLTLLDLDLGREKGGWDRIKYVAEQLLELDQSSENGQPGHLDESSKKELNKIIKECKKDGQPKKKEILAYLTKLQQNHNVFFSQPLDLDFAMLEQFECYYKSQANQGPRIPEDSEKRDEYMKMAKSAVISGEKEMGYYCERQQELFPWYRYLFIYGSKPVAHMRAMISIPPQDLISNAPESLKNIASKAKEFCNKFKFGDQ